jgi:hypothetical protein
LDCAFVLRDIVRLAAGRFAAVFGLRTDGRRLAAAGFAAFGLLIEVRLATGRFTVRFAAAFTVRFAAVLGLLMVRLAAAFGLLTVRFAAGFTVRFAVRLAAALTVRFGAALTVRFAAVLGLLTVRLAAAFGLLTVRFAAAFTVRFAAVLGLLTVRLAAAFGLLTVRFAAAFTVRFAAGLVALVRDFALAEPAGRRLAALLLTATELSSPVLITYGKCYSTGRRHLHTPMQSFFKWLRFAAEKVPVSPGTYHGKAAHCLAGTARA